MSNPHDETFRDRVALRWVEISLNHAFEDKPEPDRFKEMIEILPAMAYEFADRMIEARGEQTELPEPVDEKPAESTQCESEWQRHRCTGSKDHPWPHFVLISGVGMEWEGGENGIAAVEVPHVADQLPEVERTPLNRCGSIPDDHFGYLSGHRCAKEPGHEGDHHSGSIGWGRELEKHVQCESESAGHHCQWEQGHRGTHQQGFAAWQDRAARGGQAEHSEPTKVERPPITFEQARKDLCLATNGDLVCELDRGHEGRCWDSECGIDWQCDRKRSRGEPAPPDFHSDGTKVEPARCGAPYVGLTGATPDPDYLCLCRREPGHEGGHRAGSIGWPQEVTKVSQCESECAGHRCNFDTGHEGLHRDINDTTWPDSAARGNGEDQSESDVEDEATASIELCNNSTVRSDCAMTLGHDGPHTDGLVEWPNYCNEWSEGERCLLMKGHDGYHNLYDVEGEAPGSRTACDNKSGNGYACLHAAGHEGQHGNGRYIWPNLCEAEIICGAVSVSSVSAIAPSHDEAASESDVEGERPPQDLSSAWPKQCEDQVHGMRCKLLQGHDGMHSDDIVMWGESEISSP